MLLSGASAHSTAGRMLRVARAAKADKAGKTSDKETVESTDSEMMMATATAPTEPHEADFSELEEEEALRNDFQTYEETGEITSMGGMNTLQTEFAGEDNSVRLLKREGTILGLFPSCITFDTLTIVSCIRCHQRNPHKSMRKYA